MPTAPLLAILGSRFSPKRVSGLTTWYSAADVTGLADGDPTVTETNAGSSGGSITQGTASKRGTWKSSALNGRPAIRFDGTDDCYAGSAAQAAIAGPYTLFVACNPSSVAAASRFLLELGQAASNNINFYLYFNAGVIETGYHDGTNFKGFQGLSVTAGTAYVITARFTGAVLDTWRNGTSSGTPFSTATTPTTAGTQTLNVGSDRAGTNVFAGDIAEVLIYNRSVVDAERRSIERYLATQYGVALA